MAAGLAISQNGETIVVANYENDSISVLTKTASAWAKSGELDLRPGVLNPAQDGIPGGAYPYWVSINSTAYISSIREDVPRVVESRARRLG
jgi:DNA-binding beta-propeller fold protein YncE